MHWCRNELAFLANAKCTVCRGTGVRRESKGEPLPCRCALRAVFRACYQRFRMCAESSGLRGRVSYERHEGGRASRGFWGRKDQEYMADFELTARRHLDEWHHRLFRYHFILGAGAELCRRRLRIDRGGFYHAVYRIEAHLGEVFATLRPYALYPPRDYFALRLGPTALTDQVQTPVKPAGRAGRPRAWERIPA